jgi:hypothetical protein
MILGGRHAGIVLVFFLLNFSHQRGRILEVKGLVTGFHEAELFCQIFLYFLLNPPIGLGQGVRCVVSGSRTLGVQP